MSDRRIDPDDEGYCIHGLALDLPCTSCSGKDSVLPSESLLSIVITASYDGQCKGCNLPFPVGAMIVHHSELGWIHEKCR